MGEDKQKTRQNLLFWRALLNLAERGGFEPPIAFDYSRFPGVRVKPLCHLSERAYFKRFLMP